MNWLDIFYAFLSLLGGIGVFLYGMKLMGDSLEMVAGNEIKRMFAKISNKKLIGVGIGTVTTAVVQSSAAVTVMAIGFVNSGLMTLTQAASIVFGANIGTTSTALIVALGAGGFANVNLTVIFAALAGVGALMIMLTKRIRLKNRRHYHRAGHDIRRTFGHDKLHGYFLEVGQNQRVPYKGFKPCVAVVVRYFVHRAYPVVVGGQRYRRYDVGCGAFVV